MPPTEQDAGITLCGASALGSYLMPSGPSEMGSELRDGFRTWSSQSGWQTGTMTEGQVTVKRKPQLQVLGAFFPV